MDLHDIFLFKIKNERLSRREWLVPNAQSRNLMGVGRELTQGTGITKDLVPQDEAVLQEEALAWIAKRTTDGAVLYKQGACTSGRLRTTQDGGLRTTSGRSHGHLQDGELIENGNFGLSG
ncbi:hypothetical protein BZG00_11650 [Salinivibrio kushneri]|uniref:Uncharacterized protein n=1 Tax=Salinivibrio kushneri TaxID=1908198 RepID=A0AB36JTS1_9GAMM|nr:hypothetical protein BZG00_11650 [Salinivibrio kushneri]